MPESDKIQRNFECHLTGEKCSDSRCKKGYCARDEENKRRAHLAIPVTTNQKAVWDALRRLLNRGRT